MQRTPHRALRAIRVILILGIFPGCSDGHDHSVPSWRVRHRAVESFDPNEDRWHREAPLPRDLGRTQGVVVGNHLYIAGGDMGHSMFHRLQLDGGRWEQLPFLPRLRMDHACVALGDEIYVLGGWPGDHGQAVDIYSIPYETWSAGPELPEPRDGCEAVTLDGRIYIVSGRETTIPYTDSTLDVLDPGVGQWQALSPMPAFSHSMAMGTDGSSIYVVAEGRSNPDVGRLFIYDPGADAWSQGPDLPVRTGGYCEGALVRTLFYIAGNIHEDRRNMLVYDTVGQTWDWVKPFKIKRGHPGVVGTTDRVFVIGGS